jgi:CHAD domain-containing protein
VAEVFKAVARSALESIAANAELLRQRADPDAVHQLRVAARALRSALATFRKAVEDAGSEEGGYVHAKAELRWLAKSCDQARNLDVFIAETLDPAEDLEPRPQGLAALRQTLGAARDEAHAEVARTVSSARFRDLLIVVTGWVDTGAWSEGEAARGSARAFARKMLDKRRRRLLRDGGRLDTATDAQRHAARIDAKKLRYAAEGFEGLFRGKAARRFIEQQKALQDELGALNDLVTAEALLAQFALPPDAAFAAGELVGLKAAAKDRHIACAVEAMKALKAAEPFWK